MSSKQCFEGMRFVKVYIVFIANMLHPLQPKKGVVIYKLVVAFELAQFSFRKKSPYEGWNPFLEKKIVLYKVYCVLNSFKF